MKHVVLDDVANCARLFVQPSTPLHAEVLGHHDLHAFDKVAVPDRLEKRVAEPKIEQILDRLLAKIVIDAEYRRLWEDGQK